MKKILLTLLASLSLSCAHAQSIEDADKLYTEYRDKAIRGESAATYEMMYDVYQAYASVLKSSAPQSDEYNRCKERLLDLFPRLAEGAYLFTELEKTDLVIKFAQAYVDLSLMYAFSDLNLSGRPEYDAQVAYFAAYHTCMQGRYQEAIDYYRAYISTTDTESEEHAFQGMIFAFQNLKHYDEIQYFASLAVKKYPENWELVHAGIDAAIKTKNDEYLRIFLPLGLKLRPGNIGLTEYMAQLCERDGKYAEAYIYYQRLDAYKPNNLEICCHLALDSYNKGVQLTETANLMPNEGDAKTYQTQAQEAFNTAIPLLKDVLGNCPYAINFAKALAMSYSAIGDEAGLKEANENIADLKGKLVAQGTVPVLERNYNPNPGSVPVLGNDFVSDVDQDIPSAAAGKNKHTYAIIIGNENYKHVSKVHFANNDARSFSEYCHKVLGLPKENIRMRLDATIGEMGEQMNFIKEKARMNPDKLSFIVYYAGHGMPDVANNGAAYLLPTDATGTDLQYAYSLKRMLDELDALEAKRVTVFLDACFSGATRDDGMIFEERSIAYVPEETEVEGKTIVFSATEGKQTALPYDAQHHGIFTYHLLNNLKESGGQITLGALAESLKRQVDNTAYDTKNKHQNPKVSVPDYMGDDWKEMMLTEK